MQRQSTSMVTTAALIGLFLATSAPKVMAEDACGTHQYPPPLLRSGSSISGHSTLVVDNEGVDVVIRAENLTSGVAYTTWFAYFGNTGQCLVPYRCANADLSTPASSPAAAATRWHTARLDLGNEPVVQLEEEPPILQALGLFRGRVLPSASAEPRQYPMDGLARSHLCDSNSLGVRLQIRSDSRPHEHWAD